MRLERRVEGGVASSEATTQARTVNTLPGGSGADFSRAGTGMLPGMRAVAMRTADVTVSSAVW